jgi:hypothetical protein
MLVMKCTRFKRRACSLSEILVALTVVGAIAVVTAPVVTNARNASGYGFKMSSENQVGRANAMYLVDYDPQLSGTSTDPPKAVHFTTQNNFIPAATITYHGGPVMLGTTKVYYIWYGNWAGNSAVTILTDLAQNIGGSAYFNINSTYYNGSGTHVSNSVSYGGSTNDNYSQGKNLSDRAIKNVVSSAISSGRLPNDTSAVYFVLTSSDVSARSGFCTQYCGWHTYSTISGSNIKYSFVGNPDRCPSACEAQSSGPNGNAGADGMASIIAHELEEAVTDPNLNAWYTSGGAENADICAWTFGTTYASGGALANVHLGSRDYLIQQNWPATNTGCTMHYP